MCVAEGVVALVALVALVRSLPQISALPGQELGKTHP